MKITASLVVVAVVSGAIGWMIGVVTHIFFSEPMNGSIHRDKPRIGIS